MENFEIASFEEIREEFLQRVTQVIWCNVATIDTQGRPRSRILHPVWEGHIGWVATRRNTLKSKHLDHTHYVSLAYITDVAKPVYADCEVTWIDDLAEKTRIWNFIKDTPEPVGYDPTPIFGSVENENLGVLKLTPWRIEVADFPIHRHIWHVNKEL
ncbi:MAG: pyridoxamine 5'-phosphate oxidase [Chloroflexi bacterium]|nr:pyridoxamine 5'-phosphate oxidase [Chloroflexota bacterium]